MTPGGDDTGDDDTPPPPPPPPDDQQAADYDGAAMSIGVSMVENLFAMNDSVILSFGGTPDGFTRVSNEEVFGTRAGVTYHYSYFCADDNDIHLAVCDANANHNHVTLTVSGDLEGSLSGMSLTAIDEGAKWQVRDLKVAKPRVGGTGHMAFSNHVEADGSAYDVSFDGTYDHVRFQPTGGLPYFGTITFAAVIHRNRPGVDPAERDYAVGANLVFTDTTATLTLDATFNYSLDLATGVVTKL